MSFTVGKFLSPVALFHHGGHHRGFRSRRRAHADISTLAVMKRREGTKRPGTAPAAATPFCRNSKSGWPGGNKATGDGPTATSMRIRRIDARIDETRSRPWGPVEESRSPTQNEEEAHKSPPRTRTRTRTTTTRPSSTVYLPSTYLVIRIQNGGEVKRETRRDKRTRGPLSLTRLTNPGAISRSHATK